MSHCGPFTDFSLSRGALPVMCVISFYHFAICSAPAAETQAAAVAGAWWAEQSVSGQLNANMAHGATALNKTLRMSEIEDGTQLRWTY